MAILGHTTWLVHFFNLLSDIG